MTYDDWKGTAPEDELPRNPRSRYPDPYRPLRPRQPDRLEDFDWTPGVQPVTNTTPDLPDDINF